MRPTIYLSNWSSKKTPGAHGPGRAFTIMGRPRAWEHGDGICRKLAPLDGAEPDLLRAALARRTPEAVAAYRRTIETRWTSDAYMLQPGMLTAVRPSANAGYILADGDTLCCACARGADCHRRWAAPFLHRAGWSVVLDGAVFG